LKKRILVVDDHPIIFTGLQQLLSPQTELEVIGNAKNVDEALNIIATEIPDLVIIDIGLKSEKDGLVLVKEISEGYPMVKTMVLSMHDEEIYSKRAAEAGARGYVNKSEFTEKIDDALSAILGGDTFFTKPETKIKQSSEERKMFLLQKLTEREFEILKLIGKGYGNDKISEILDLKEKTIQSHKLRIRNKLNFANGQEMYRAVMKWSLEDVL
jgi:DNA-binding NarL/FixJ family response regulator